MVSDTEEHRRCRRRAGLEAKAAGPARAHPGASGWLRHAFPIAVLVLLAAGVAAPSWGATFADLYTVTLALEPGDSTSPADVERRAMQRVLTRVTGDRTAATDPELQHLVDSAREYIENFGTPEPGRFRVGFISTSIERQLSALGRPIWGRERPLTLVWIAVDAGADESAVLGEGGLDSGVSDEMAQTLATIRRELQEVADERGLPIAFPLLDLEDMSVLGFDDIWSGFDERVELASRRYDADAVLIGRVWQTEFGTEVHWTLLWNGERAFMVGRSGSDGLHWAGDMYAAELSAAGGGSHTVRLTVLDVASQRDYFRVMSYLEQASLVQSVDWEDFEDGALSLRVSVRGGPGVLERVLSLGGVLAAAGPGNGNDLIFRVARQGMDR